MPVAVLERTMPASEVEEWRIFLQMRDEQMKQETLRAELDAKASAGAASMGARFRPRGRVRR